MAWIAKGTGCVWDWIGGEKAYLIPLFVFDIMLLAELQLWIFHIAMQINQSDQYSLAIIKVNQSDQRE